MSGNGNLTPLKVIDILLSFIRVIIEQIWFHFKIYPEESFRTYTFYGIQVYSSRHPGVILYLDQLCNELKKLMMGGTLVRIFLEIYDNEKRKYSFGFSFRSSLLFEQLKNDTQFVEFDSSNNIFNSFTLINELKSLLFSIINDYGKLEIKEFEPVGNFKLLISTMDDLQLSSDKNWILERYSNANKLMENNERFADIDLTPFKDINLGYLNIKSYMAKHHN